MNLKIKKYNTCVTGKGDPNTCKDTDIPERGRFIFRNVTLKRSQQ